MTHFNIKDSLKEHHFARISLIAPKDHPTRKNCLFCKADTSYFCLTCHFYRGNNWKHYPICDSATRHVCYRKHVSEMNIGYNAT